MDRNNTEIRYYFLDKLRIYAIILLIFLHTAMIFTGWKWHLQSETSAEAFRAFCLFVHEWRMPLLFFVSGMASKLSINNKSLSEFGIDRLYRLLIPLLFGTLILVPPQVYIERVHLYSNYIDFYPDFFSGLYPKGNFFWHHLWFLGYLICYSIILIFFIYLGKYYKFHYSKNYSLFLYFILGLGIQILFQILLRPYFKEDTYSLYNDFANFTYYLFYFLYGYIILELQLLEKIREHGIKFFIFFIISTIILFIWYYSHFDYNYNYSENLRNSVKYSIKTSMGLGTILLFVSYSYKYINNNTKYLTEINKGIYPVYLVHQTIIVVFGYEVLKWGVGMILSYFIISFTTLFLSIFFSYFVVRKFSILNFFFGTKKI